MKTFNDDADVTSIKHRAKGAKLQQWTDATKSGLYLRVARSKAGTTKTFAVRWTQFNEDGTTSPRTKTVGTFPAVNVETARDIAARIIQAEVAPVDEGLTVDEALRRYEIEHLRGVATGHRIMKEIDRALCDHMATPIRQITKSDVLVPIRAKRAEGFDVAANKLQTALVTFFGWCAREDLIDDTPCRNMPKKSAEAPRTRKLSVDECRMIYGATLDAWPVVALLVLTACRRSEITELTLDEIDRENRRLVIPWQRMKARKEVDGPHVVPLSDPAWQIVTRALDDHDEDAPGDAFLFKTRRDLSNIKRHMPELTEAYTLHDFRTGFATALDGVADILAPDGRLMQRTACRQALETAVTAGRMIRPAFDDATLQACLAHKLSGAQDRNAISAVYNQGDRLPFRATALNFWADLVAGPKAVDEQVAA